jgi:hypothetical protein
MVYCITNDTSTAPMDECRRRGQGGIITLKQPEVISKYNQYMGGVNVADMRQLHCNSTVMGQNRWWLKLFFYLLDAGTSNALVVYNATMKGKQKPYNIADYKAKVVEALVGGKLKDGNEDDKRIANMPWFPFQTERGRGACTVHKQAKQAGSTLCVKAVLFPSVQLGPGRLPRIVLHLHMRMRRFDSSALKILHGNKHTQKGKLWRNDSHSIAIQ